MIIEWEMWSLDFSQGKYGQTKQPGITIAQHEHFVTICTRASKILKSQSVRLRSVSPIIEKN